MSKPSIVFRYRVITCTISEIGVAMVVMVMVRVMVVVMVKVIVMAMVMETFFLNFVMVIATGYWRSPARSVKCLERIVRRVHWINNIYACSRTTQLNTKSQGTPKQRHVTLALVSSENSVYATARTRFKMKYMPTT